MDISFLYGLLVSVGIGALIGMERERRRAEDTVLVGVRTFPLVSTSGFVIGHLAVNEPFMDLLVIAGLILFGTVALLLVYVRQAMGYPGFTTTLALIVTYLLGVMVAYDLILEAVVVGVITTFLLLSKERLHRLAKVLTKQEMMGALQFITIAFILYPLTLDLDLTGTLSVFSNGEPLDLNMVLLIVLFVSAISFTSFLVVRLYGPTRGIRFSGLLGGLVNSEAATASLCNMVKKNWKLVGAASSGIILANATMFVRNLAVCAIADPSLSTAVVVALPLVGVTLLGIAIGWSIKGEKIEKTLEVESPFAIVPALKFGLLFMVISGLALGIQEFLGSGAIYLTALGGFASSAAVVASVSSLAMTGSIDPWLAAQTIMLACGVSSFNKILISRIVCPDLSRKATLGLSLSTAAAFVAALILAGIKILP